MKYFAVLLLMVFGKFLYAQAPVDPVRWEFSSKKIDTHSFELHLTAYIQDGWHIYSQYNEGGPGPASIVFKRNPLLVKKSVPREIGNREHIDEDLFQSRVYAFADKVDFVQIFFRKKEKATSVQGKIKFMACNGTICLPPKEMVFSIDLN